MLITLIVKLPMRTHCYIDISSKFELIHDTVNKRCKVTRTWL